jgi:hypothetical protein
VKPSGRQKEAEYRVCAGEVAGARLGGERLIDDRKC